jgi:hypothetical protein
MDQLDRFVCGIFARLDAPDDLATEYRRIRELPLAEFTSQMSSFVRRLVLQSCLPNPPNLLKSASNLVTKAAAGLSSPRPPVEPANYIRDLNPAVIYSSCRQTIAENADLERTFTARVQFLPELAAQVQTLLKMHREWNEQWLTHQEDINFEKESIRLLGDIYYAYDFANRQLTAGRGPPNNQPRQNQAAPFPVRPPAQAEGPP